MGKAKHLRPGGATSVDRVEGPKFELIMGGRAPLFNEALKLCDPATVIDPGSKGAEQLMTVLSQLREANDAGRYLQGGLLARLREGDTFKAIAPDLTFPEFCEKKVGLGHRTVLMLIQIHEKATELGLSPERLSRIGWTKAREFLRIAKKDDVEQWIDKATKLSSAALKTAIAEQKARKPADYSEEDQKALKLRVRFGAMLTEDERANVESAVEEAAKLAGRDLKHPDTRAHALDFIATEWRANHLDSKQRSLAWHVAQLRRVYKGAKITVEQPATPKTGRKKK